MRVVWDSEPCSVEAVYEVVSRDRDLKETTIRTLLRRLEQKGYLRHESEGRAYLYRSTERPRSLAARAVRQIIDRFCQGSVEELPKWGQVACWPVSMAHPISTWLSPGDSHTYIDATLGQVVDCGPPV